MLGPATLLLVMVGCGGTSLVPKQIEATATAGAAAVYAPPTVEKEALQRALLTVADLGDGWAVYPAISDENRKLIGPCGLTITPTGFAAGIHFVGSSPSVATAPHVFQTIAVLPPGGAPEYVRHVSKACADMGYTEDTVQASGDEILAVQRRDDGPASFVDDHVAVVRRGDAVLLVHLILLDRDSTKTLKLAPFLQRANDKFAAAIAFQR